MQHPCHQHQRYTRREFLGVLSAATITAVATGCQSQTQPLPATDAIGAKKKTPAGAASATRPIVAVTTARDYTPATVRKQVRELLDATGGLKGIVSSNSSVAIKVNLTGGVSSPPLPGVSAIESYVTHPEVVRALGEFVLEAGAKKLYIVEAVYEDASWTTWGYDAVAKSLGATLVDLNNTWPYNDFAQVPVGDGAFIYKNFNLNHILQDVDTFMSVPKMKTHNIAGITLSMKNLFGLAPLRFYRQSEQDNYRSGFHGQANETGNRVPHIIVDLNRARPINFALIDGIKSSEGGEGPWINGVAPLQPGLLLAGADPLATDTVGTALMGYDATTPAKKEPFVNGENHFAIATSIGLGTNRLSDIDVVGPAISDVMKKFKSSY